MDKVLNLLNTPMLIEPSSFHGWLQSVRLLKPVAQEQPRVRPMRIEGEAKEILLSINAGYAVTQSGVAVVPIMGPMFKGFGPWGYADQAELKATLKAALNDPNVGGIMLLIDSPGGSVAGTQDLADQVQAVNAAKPVVAYIEDMGASAAYWVASRARAIYSNATALVGSIGVVTALIDASKYYEGAGIKITPIVTGKYKAVGDPSQPVTQDAIDYVQQRIDDIFEAFVNDVAKGRGIRGETVKKLEAAVFVGEKAQTSKLTNGVMSFDKAYTALLKEMKNAGGNRNAKAMQRQAEIE